jgi:hypothetical protein
VRVHRDHLGPDIGDHVPNVGCRNLTEVADVRHPDPDALQRVHLLDVDGDGLVETEILKHLADRWGSTDSLRLDMNLEPSLLG